MRGWLETLAWISLIAAGVCALLILVDILAGRPQKMAIMNAVWPITALYLGPLGLWVYWMLGRPAAKASHLTQGHANQERPSKPFWQSVFVSTTHCGAGCVLGDILGEWTVFVAALTIAGSRLWADYVVDFALAYVADILFQYFSIVPMCHLAPLQGLRDAVKADTLSLVAFEIGMFGWMALMALVLFRSSPLHPNEAVYWFMMQIGMIAGFLTSYPANWLLVRVGIKHGM
jgi:hypothetical protein